MSRTPAPRMSAQEYPSDRYGLPRSDHSLWRLVTDELGSTKWVYDKEHRIKPTNFTKFQMQSGFDAPTLSTPTNASGAAANAAHFLAYIQDESGIFPCQYGGPMFMLIGYVVAKYFCKVPFSPEEKAEICRYLVNRAHPVDGGWGLHTYGDSTAFGTSINYVILRLLGMPPSHPALVKARTTLHRLGGAIGNPMWGKVYLALLNLYKWEGINPSPPEVWLLPEWTPVHPGRWWVHTRAIYLPMGYLSMHRSQAELDPLLEAIRSEIYVQPFDKIDFSKHRNTVCGVDLYYPHSWALDAANVVLAAYENVRPKWVREKLAARCLDLIMKDNENTDYRGIAPVSCAMNSIVVYLAKGGNSPEFKRMADGWANYMFMTPEGMFMCGTDGVQVWDVAFALQYIVRAGLAAQFHPMLIRGYRFLIRSQFTEDCVADSYRDHRNGGWPFSTKPQGFTVSDCTAEAVKAIIMVQNVPGLEHLKSEISEQRLRDAVDILLSLQMKSTSEHGALAAYERIKGSRLLEKLNPAEVFADIMIEYPYVECTDSTVLGLHYFTSHFDYRKDEIAQAISAATKYIIKRQNSDGSWYGSWGVCFLYAGMFAIEALETQGLTYSNSDVVRKACEFVVKRQEDDGGWAEDFRSCEIMTYVRHSGGSQVVQTAWALITLVLAKYTDRAVLDRAAQLLMSKQNPDGSYDWNHAEGVFNHSCAIEYPNYRFYFPMKALGMYASYVETMQ